MLVMYSGGYSHGFKSASADNLSTFDDGDGAKHNKVKRLSLETNRRRRELAVRLKKEAEKEEKRKQEILEQRREKQRQATERFQRSFSARNRRSPVGFRARSPSRSPSTDLDAMLATIRGPGSSLTRVTSWDSVRHHAWGAAADAADPWRQADLEAQTLGAANTNNNNAFQSRLEERRQRLAQEQRRHLAAFSKVVETFVEPEAAPVDSLEFWGAAPNSELESFRVAEISLNLEPDRAPDMKKPDSKPDKYPDVTKPDKYPDMMKPDTKSDKYPDMMKPDTKSDKYPDMMKPDTKPDKYPDVMKPDKVPEREPESSKPPPASAIPVPKARVQPHFRFVVDEKKEEQQEEEEEEEEGSSGVKSILKRKSVYSPPGHRSPAPVRDSLEVARGHRLGRSFSEEHLASEEPEGRRRKSVRFAARLTEDLTSPKRTEAELPSPKPRRLFSAHATPSAAGTRSSGPSAPVRVSGKPPQHPGTSPGRSGGKPERITSAALAKVASNSASALRHRVPSATGDEEPTKDAQPEAPNLRVPQQPEQQQEQQRRTQQLNQQSQQQLNQQPNEQLHQQPYQQPNQQPIQQPNQQVYQQQNQQPVSSKSNVTVIPSAAALQPRLSSTDPIPNGAPPSGFEQPVRVPNGSLHDSLENYPVDKTPTESDIEWLWAKVRSCLHRPDPSDRGSITGSVGGDSNSELSIQSAPARAVAPMSSQLIDGASIHLGVGRARLRGGHPGDVRAVHHHSISPHARRLALLRQRELNQHLQRTTDVTDSQAVTESMADFLENEAMCQQSQNFNNTAPASVGSRLSAASEPQENPGGPVVPQPRPLSGMGVRRRVVSREQHRPPSLQNYSPGSYIAPHPPPVRRGSAGPIGVKRPHQGNGYRPMSSLSIEEQRLMKSLERINDKLKTTGLSK